LRWRFETASLNTRAFPELYITVFFSSFFVPGTLLFSKTLFPTCVRPLSQISSFKSIVDWRTRHNICLYLDSPSVKCKLSGLDKIKSKLHRSSPSGELHENFRCTFRIQQFLVIEESVLDVPPYSQQNVMVLVQDARSINMPLICSDDVK